MEKMEEVFTDGYGRTEKQIYEELLRKSTIPINFDVFVETSEDNALFFDYRFLEDDANELLANIGLDQNFDLTNYPRNQLKRIFRYYHPKQETIVNGKKEYVDPLPDYRVGKGTYEEELFKFGYLLGKGGTLGIYYRLLPNFQFRRGYWVGKMERSVELNDNNVLRELSNEMKIYDATQADDEMGFIVNNIFRDEEDPVATVTPTPTGTVSR